ncbi:MAG: GGDEF domain-containing protein [Candidatus Omnitrophica bacterium]|nr:GGDEF domain-containing protein [Candidatus Omnitrophota bacterium]
MIPPSLLAGPLTALGGCALLLGWRKKELTRQIVSWNQEKESLLRRVVLLEEKSEQGEAAVRKQEESIQGIAKLYGLSKQFLATLDPNEAMEIAEEAVAKWLPGFSSQERAQVLSQVRSSAALPQHLRDSFLQEQAAMIGVQLALGFQRIRLYAQVQELAIHDGLTGLLVRRHFLERLEEEVARALRRNSSAGFLMLDLDHFKAVNDASGHLVGDLVLREVARRIKGIVREMDLVGRVGGEEFAVALPEAGKPFAISVADRIREAVGSLPIQAYDETVRVTVSVGVALCPEDAKSAQELIDRADESLYRAKAAGRNRTVAAEGQVR